MNSRVREDMFGEKLTRFRFLRKIKVKNPTCKTGTWGTQIHFNDRFLGYPP